MAATRTYIFLRSSLGRPVFLIHVSGRVGHGLRLSLLVLVLVLVLLVVLVLLLVVGGTILGAGVRRSQSSALEEPELELEELELKGGRTIDP